MWRRCASCPILHICNATRSCSAGTETDCATSGSGGVAIPGDIARITRDYAFQVGAILSQVLCSAMHICGCWTVQLLLRANARVAASVLSMPQTDAQLILVIEKDAVFQAGLLR